MAKNEEKKEQKSKGKAKQEFDVILKGKVGFLRVLVSRLRALVDECQIEFAMSKKEMSKEEKILPIMHIKVVDPAHVALLEMFVHPKALTMYNCSGKAELGNDWSIKTKGITLGIDLDTLIDKVGASKHNKNTDKFRLMHEPKTNRWHLELTKSHVHKLKKFRDTSIEGMNNPTVPDLNLPAIVKGTAFTPEFLYKIITEIESDKVSDHIRIVITDEKDLLLMAEGDTDECAYTIHGDDDINIDTEERAASLFPLDYFVTITKAMKSMKTVSDRTELELRVGQDYPIRLEMKEFMGSSLVMETRYLLAPRIESE